MFKVPDQKLELASLELEITKFWKDNDIFHKSINNRSIDNKYVFYDGPPFITGTPHYGSLLPSIVKDVIPRYQTMKGKRVERVWGWDCHGLPIETKVEKALNIKNRKEIESFGIQRFVDECYKYTRNTSAEWKWYIDKIGRWVDFDDSYKTMDQDYMESVLWAFKRLYEKGIVYEGVRTSLYCTRCSTPISNFEIAMDNSYSDMEDPAVTVKFPILEGKFKGASILAWTTTPWTVPSNKALVVDPEETYILAQVQKLDIELEKAWLVKELPDLKGVKFANITQAYLDDYKDTSGLNFNNARIRKKDNEYTFTVKYFAGSRKETGQIIEKTEEITKERYIELIKQASSKVVKKRYYIPLEQGLIAELDIYENNLKGLNVVEVEFPSLRKEKEFKKPEWFSKEVTDSDGIYPPFIAGLTIDEVMKINEVYHQAPHDYEHHQISEKVILAKKRIEHVLKDIDNDVLMEFSGKELLGLKYDPPFHYFDPNEKEHHVYSYKDMVTMEEGTGIVHSAPGFGDIDTQMGKHYGLEIGMSIDDEGKYFDFIDEYKGLYVKDADPYITADLDKMGRLFRSERIVHRYPYCYRCSTPLLQKAQPSWFVNIQDMKEDLLKNNDKINWVPKHLKTGRFKKGIEMAPDWCISRTRYWASPMPVWQRMEDGKIVERVVIGSRDELRERSTTPITKIVLIRHAEVDDKFIDILKKRFKGFDELYHSSCPSVSKDLPDLCEGIDMQAKENDAFGTHELHMRFLKLQESFNEKLGDAPEEELKRVFGELIEIYWIKFKQLLDNNKGKMILGFTHAEVIIFLRHMFEGRSLKESFSLKVVPLDPSVMYFNGNELLDLHRPKIDNIKIQGDKGELIRVKEVLDVWMDSASMPYASKHYPFEDSKDYENNFPADFVTEYMAQTRAWFYVMHVLSTALFSKEPFKNVVTTGVIFGTDGRKMSKSYGNYPDPKLVLEKYGAEPLRLYLMGSPIMIGEDMNLNEEGLKEQVRNFILPLWNCYSFFITYANIHKWEIKKVDSKNELDKWINIELNNSIKNITRCFDEYDIPSVVREYLIFLEKLSKWYIRRSRDRFLKGDEEVLSTLYYVLLDFSKLIAPIAPFISEEIYRNLINAKADESVHLEDFPAFKKISTIDIALVDNMNLVRDIVNLGQSIRAQKGIKVRQVLKSVMIKTKKDVDTEQWMDDLIKDELNVKEVLWNKRIQGDGWELANSLDGNIEVCLYTILDDELLKEGYLRELIRSIQDMRKKMGLTIGEMISIDLSTSATIIKSLIGSDILKESLSADKITLVEEIKDGIKLKINGEIVIIKINK